MMVATTDFQRQDRPGARVWAEAATTVVLGAILAILAACGAKGSSPAPSPELFAAFAPVLQHPRCLNCHPSDNYPRQGDDRRRHFLNVQRGPADQGVVGMRCFTCHQDRNQDYAGVPGAPHWQLAPSSMGWQGLSVGEMCRSILDPGKNGNRSLADLVKHLNADPLVLWAWQPGSERQPPPLSRDEFMLRVRAWADAGAPCPP